MTDTAIEEIERNGIVPVIVLEAVDDAVELASALLSGGITCAEIVLRTEAALPAIARLAELPGFTVGAGTVRSIDAVDRAVDAGADFLVSPGFHPPAVERAGARGVTMIPGVATATDIERALSWGLDRLKLFPAEQLGGVSVLRAFAGPFPEVRFMPSGGVSDRNSADYAALATVFAVSGSWMLPPVLMRERRFDEIARRARVAVEAIR